MKFKSSYLISLQAILFSVFLLITFFFNRFAVDDYHFIGALKTTSFQEIYSHLYYDWHGRWTSNFLLVYFLKISQIPLFLMLYNIFSVGLLYLGSMRFLNTINTFYQVNLKKESIITYNVIFVSVLFFCTISANDTWLWYTSSIVYLWSTIAFFFGLSIFFKQQKSFLDFSILGVSAIYIGGSNEPLTFFIILSLFYLIFKKKETAISSLGLVLIISSFLINYLSPGTSHRDEITPNLSFIDLILYTGYSSIKFLLFSFHKTFLPALFLALPFYLLGKKATPLAKNFNPIKELIWSLITVVSIVFANQLIVVYALGGLPPDRSGIASTIFIAIILIRYLFLLGNHHQGENTTIKYVLIFNVLALIVFNIYHANIHYKYANAVDERIEFIKENDNGIIYLTPLPNSGYIYSAEITTDADNFKNQHLKNGLGINNDIILTTDR